MQHIYSLRPTRATTAASEENPLPSPSTAKARRFVSNNIGHAIRRTAGGTLSAPLAKKLAQLVKMEKNILRSMENVSTERIDNARQLSLWGDEQEDDVSDISDKLAVLLAEVGDLEDQYVDRYDQYRKALKQIRDIEKGVQPVREKKQKLVEQIAKLESKSAEETELASPRQELVRVEAESLVAEAQLSAITRDRVKSGFNYQFDAMREFGEKLAIIAGYGKHLLELIHETDVMPGEDRVAYNSHEASAAIIKECDRTLTTWVGSNSFITPQLSVHTQSIKPGNETLHRNEGPGTSANTRRWSSDSETTASPPHVKRTDAVAA